MNRKEDPAGLGGRIVSLLYRITMRNLSLEPLANTVLPRAVADR